MDRHACLRAEAILAGTAEVEDGYIRSTTVGDSGKESTIHVVEALEEVLASSFCHPALQKMCLVALPAICATYKMLPSRCSYTGNLIVEHQSTTYVGGVEERRGTLGGLRVTVKSISYNSAGSSGASGSQESAYRQIITWKNLNHPNISPLLGADTSTSPLSAISLRAEYGSLREYLAGFPNAPRPKLLFDVSQGLEYMHRHDCIHGDMKSFSVLVNGDHSAVISNFRLSSFLPDPDIETGVPILERELGSVRWLAPELLFPEKFGLGSARLTKETDIYAFAMVMYEAFSGLFPFDGIRDETLILLVRSGERPCRPEGGSGLGLTEELWKAMKACWKRKDRRWKISRIVSTLECHSATTTATAMEEHSQLHRSSNEAPVQPTHGSIPQRPPWRTRWRSVLRESD